MDYPFDGPRGRKHMHRSAFESTEGGGEGRRGRGGRRHGGPMGGPVFPPMPPMPPGFDPFGQRRGGRRARRGDVRTAALLLIAEEPRNGYQIIQELDQRTDGRWKPSPGAVYPALSQLEDEGLIRSVDEAAGKAFEITDEGRAEAEKAAERPAPWEQTDGQEDPSHDLRHRFGQLAQAFGAVASTGNDELIAQAASEIDDLKRRLYQLLAES